MNKHIYKIKNSLKNHLGSKNFRYSLSPSGFITQKMMLSFLCKSYNRALVVGSAGREDYKVFSSKCKEVYVIDIVENTKKIKNYHKQSITKRTQFAENHFDVVIMGDVIEHLIEDYAALIEIRRILKNDGIFILSLPYYGKTFSSDSPEYHVRVHTKKTIKRLLQHCGFRIEKKYFRGKYSRLPDKILTNFLIYLAMFILPREKYVSLFYFLEMKTPEFFHKYFKSYGGVQLHPII